MGVQAIIKSHTKEIQNAATHIFLLQRRYGIDSAHFQFIYMVILHQRCSFEWVPQYKGLRNSNLLNLATIGVRTGILGLTAAKPSAVLNLW